MDGGTSFSYRPGDPLGWQTCQGCGINRAGPCPKCDGQDACRRAQEAQNEADDWRMADEERRLSGQLWCNDHDRHDGCMRKATIEEVRGSVPGPLRHAESRRQLVEQAVVERRAGCPFCTAAPSGGHDPGCPRGGGRRWEDAMSELRKRYVPPA